ncbi:hypothetical protein UB46_13105 [Burkholderiaceae bacterium 16]|nr:hypothetical protein UB46_13105 [Burkholderiaceae bacterium 16]
MTSGPTKGHPRDQPLLAVQDGRVLLYVGAGRSAKAIKTPLSKRASHGASLEPHWKHEAWVQGAVPALQAVIDRFLQRLPDAEALQAPGSAGLA